MSHIVSIETLLYIIKDNRVLLIKKKRGLGAGLYNGVGGKVKADETPFDAAIRETIEEIGVIPQKVEWAGLLEFYNDGKLYGYVHVFRAYDYVGEPKETDEAKPIWFDIDKIPYDAMWEDDKFWLPLVIKRENIYGRFFFLENWKKLAKSEVFLLKTIIKEDTNNGSRGKNNRCG